MNYSRVEELRNEAIETEDNDEEMEIGNEAVEVIVKHILECAEELKELGYEL